MAINPLLANGMRFPQEGPYIPLSEFGFDIKPFPEFQYVDPNVGGPGDGSIQKPWQKIQFAIDDALARGVPVVAIRIVALGPFVESLVIESPIVGGGLIVYLKAGPFPVVLIGAHTFTSHPMSDLMVVSDDVLWFGTASVPVASGGTTGLVFRASALAFGIFPLPAPSISSAATGPVAVVLDQMAISAGAGAGITAPTGALRMQNGAGLFGDTPSSLLQVDGLSDCELGTRIAVTSLGTSDSTPHRNVQWRPTPGALVPTWSGPLGSFRADSFSLATFLAALGALIPPATPFIGDAPRIPGNGLTDADLTVSLDGGGASAGFLNGGNWYTLGPATLTMPRSLTLDGSGAKPGLELTVTRLDKTANTYTIIDGPTATTLVVLPASKTGTVGVRASSAGSFELVHVPPT